MKIAKSTDWKTKELPEKRTTVSLDRTFSTEEMEKIRKGLIPEMMEDKWFIYWEDDKLFFHRSWTGFCLYIVYFRKDNDKYTMYKAEVNRDPEQYSETDDALDAQWISYLIDILLLHQDSYSPGGEISGPLSAAVLWGFVGRAMLDQDSDDT